MSMKKARKQQDEPGDRQKPASGSETPRSRSLLVAVAVTVTIVVVGAGSWLGLNSGSVTSGVPSPASGQSANVASTDQEIPATVTGGPSIHFVEPSFNFGTVAQGAKVTHTFVVRNVGDEPLRLIEAKGS